MITGEVTPEGEARILLQVRGSQGQEQEVSAVIDTGFTGTLTLPSSLIQLLGLPWLTRSRAQLGDGSVVQFNIFVATVIWDGQPRRIMVEEAETDPLVGMELMYGYDVSIHNLDGGPVVLRSIVQPPASA
jgi:clan AA aspartic protease